MRVIVSPPLNTSIRVERCVLQSLRRDQWERFRAVRFERECQQVRSCVSGCAPARGRETSRRTIPLFSAQGAAMSEANKDVLRRANAAVSAGDNEGFLSFCTDDIVWSAVGGETIRGKEAVRAWMAREYVAPPAFTVRELIADGDLLAALGDIVSRDEAGRPVRQAYCDVWRLHGGKLAELRAFVIPVAD
jgi:ketosteroid isomerase-like protein